MDYSNVLSFINCLEKNYGNRIAFSWLKDNQFIEVTYAELVKEAKTLAHYFNSIEFNHKKIIVITEPTANFNILLLGSLLSNNTVIPLDIKLSPLEIAGLIDHSDCDVIAYSNSQSDLFRSAYELIESTPRILNLDPGMNETYFRDVPDFVDSYLNTPDPENIAVMIYTSGTFGTPKGVMVKTSTILFQCESLAKHLLTDNKEVFLSMLPINHLFAITTDIFINLSNGSEMCLAQSLEKEHLFQCIHERGVTQMITVPLLINSIRKGIIAGLNDGPILKKIMFYTLFTIAKFIKSQKIKRKLFSSLYKKIGPGLYRMVTGGASLGLELPKWYQTIGLNLYEGYGLTETGPVLAVNTVSHTRFGSVGKPIEGIDIKIHNPNDEGIGEIYTKGPQIMKGYYKNEELTRDTFDGEYFKTGDLGLIDRDGYLFIKGRAKRLIVLDGGKKVHSEEVENFFAQKEDIGDLCILGKRQIEGQEDCENEQVILACTLNPEFYPEYSEDNIKKVKNDLLEMSQSLASYKRPQYIFVLEGELPKTTTLKVQVLKVGKLLKDKF